MKKILPLLLLFLALPLQAWVRDEAPIWKDGNVQIKTLLGTSTSYTDGCTPNTTVIEAAKQWNPYMGRVQLEVSAGTSTIPGEDNGSNEVAFTSTIYGDPFDSDVLAVTCISYTSTTRSETDILVNNLRTWDAYRGSLQTKIDLRRVIAHELGHVLGLDHPDLHYQSVTALMNSRVSSLDATAKDDQDGVANMYGTGTANPAKPPVLYDSNPYDVTCYEGQSASFYIYASSGDRPMTYQWYKDGNAIANATSTSYSISSTQLTDAGLYCCKVSNLGGTATSRSAQLKVNAAVAPKISTTFSQIRVVKGDYISIYCNTSLGTDPLSYQWYKDGVAISGFTSSYFNKGQTSASDAGTYACKVSNKAGSDQVDIAKITIVPIPVPKPPAQNYQRIIMGTEGQYTSLSVNTSSYTQSVEWYKDGVKLSGTTGNYFYIKKCTQADSGEYCAVLQNTSGKSVTSTFKFLVTPLEKQSGEWLRCLRSGSIVYFIFESPARVDRYNLETGSWLPSVALRGVPTAADINDKYLCIAFDTEVRRYSLTVENETVLFSAPSTVQSLCVWGNYVSHVANPTSYNPLRLRIYNLSDGQLCSESSDSYYLSNTLLYSPKNQKIFSRAVNISPADIGAMPVSPDGKCGAISDSPYHGTYPMGKKLYLSPGEDLLFDDSGVIYTSNGLQIAGSIGGCFTDICFTSTGSPVVLRGNKLEYWDGIKMETAIYDLGSFPAARIFLQDKTVVVAAIPSTGSALQIKTVNLSDFKKKTPSTVPDPNSVSPVPAAIISVNDGSVYVLSKTDRYLLKWDPKTASYVPGHIPLRGMPNTATYNPTLNRIYLVYSDYIVTQIRLDLGENRETYYASAPLGVQYCVPLEANNVVAEYTDSGTYRLYNKDGQLLSSLGTSSYYVEVIPSPGGKKVYLADSSYYQPLKILSVGLDGKLTLSGPTTSLSKTLKGPYSLSASGILLTGDGDFVNPLTGKITNTIGSTLNGSSFINDTPYSAVDTLNGTEIKRLGGYNYGADAQTLLRGCCASIQTLLNGNLLVAQWVDGALKLRTLDKDLNDTAPSPSRILGLASRAYVGTGDDVLIPAFVISGSSKKRILVRGLGPAMKKDISEYLADPQIVLYKVGQASPIASNDNWGTAANLSELKTALNGAFPEGSKDSALLLDLEPGAYTVVTSGVGNTKGIAMVDVYDLDSDTTKGRLVAIATRARTGTGDRVLIAGFVIEGTLNKKVHVQGLGPALGSSVAGRSLNPQLFLYGSSGLLKQNKDWNNDPEVISAQAKSGSTKLEANSKDASLAIIQPPGAYSVIIEDEDGKEAITMVEVYEIPD